MAVAVGGDSTIKFEEVRIRKKWSKKPTQYKVRLSLVELPGVGAPKPLGEKEVLIADMTFITELDKKEAVYRVTWVTDPTKANSFIYACLEVIDVTTGEVVSKKLCDTLEYILL